jgi:hypothetical protein
MSKEETRYTLENMLEEMRRAAAAAGEEPVTQAKFRKKKVEDGRKVVTKELVERIIDKVERI